MIFMKKNPILSWINHVARRGLQILYLEYKNCCDRIDRDDDEPLVFSNWVSPQPFESYKSEFGSVQKVIYELIHIHTLLSSNSDTMRYENSSIWSAELANGGLSKLIDALQKKDIEKASFLLSNFWAVEGGTIGATYNPGEGGVVTSD